MDFSHFLTTVLATVAIPVLKYLYSLMFVIDSKLKEQVNTKFFIPTYMDIRNIIFTTVTKENKGQILKHLVSIYSTLNSDGARYYVPEQICFKLDELCVLFHNSNDISKLDNAFQEFCEIYFIEYNSYRDSTFRLFYSIVPNHKDKIKKIRKKRERILFIIVIVLAIAGLFILCEIYELLKLLDVLETIKK